MIHTISPADFRTRRASVLALVTGYVLQAEGGFSAFCK